jgi:hypothetical protein
VKAWTCQAGYAPYGFKGETEKWVNGEMEGMKDKRKRIKGKG